MAAAKVGLQDVSIGESTARGHMTKYGRKSYGGWRKMEPLGTSVFRNASRVIGPQFHGLYQ